MMAHPGCPLQAGISQAQLRRAGSPWHTHRALQESAETSPGSGSQHQPLPRHGSGQSCTNSSDPFHLGAFAISHPFSVNINPLPCPSADLHNSVCLPHLPLEHVVSSEKPCDARSPSCRAAAAHHERRGCPSAAGAAALGMPCLSSELPPARPCRALPKTWGDTVPVMRCAQREITCKKSFLQGFQQENTAGC